MALTSNHQLALDQQRIGFASIRDSNRALDSKLSTMLGGGGIVFGLLSAIVALGATESAEVGEWPLLLLVAVVAVTASYVGMIWITIGAWRPVDSGVPASLDYNEVFERFIEVDNDNAYAEVIESLIQCTSQAVKANKSKARAMRWSAALLLLQAMLLATVLIYRILVASGWLTLTIAWCV